MTDCLFCKIAKNEIPNHVVFEDESFKVIIDAFPNVEGQLVLISKEHVSSKFSDLSDELLKEAIVLTKKIAKALEKALDLNTTAQVTEGLMVDHMHMKLFPVHKDREFDLVNLESLSPRATEHISEDLAKKLLDKIKSNL